MSLSERVFVNRLSSLFMLLLAAITMMSAGGCSIGSALGQPAFVDFKEFEVGTPRMRVTEIIGPPKASTQQPPDNHLLDYHEFKSGTPGATRLRAVGYIVGDVLTLGLAEIIFWPMELTIAKPRDFKGHIAYDTEQHISGYRIVYDDGILAKEGGAIPR
jgi:hypothetical protein